MQIEALVRNHSSSKEILCFSTSRSHFTEFISFVILIDLHMEDLNFIFISFVESGHLCMWILRSYLLID